MLAHHQIVTRMGGPETLELRTNELGRPASGDVLVRVTASGVSYGDILVRLGIIPGSPKPPFVPGYDIAGVVEELGPDVRGIEVGQPVCALLPSGGYSDRIEVASERLVVRPDSVTDVQAAALALNYFIAQQMLHRVATVREGQRVVVHGASGGVGVAFLQLAGLAGIEVYGTASTDKLDIVRKYGGIPIDYRNQDFVETVRSLSGGGVDAVFDAIGGPHFHRSYSVLRRGGIMVGYGQSAALVDGRPRKAIGARGFLGGIIAPKLLPDGKRTTFYNAWSLEKTHPRAYREDLSTVLQLLAEGKVEPLIAKTVPLAEAADAQRELEAGAVRGKLVLTTSGD